MIRPTGIITADNPVRARMVSTAQATRRLFSLDSCDGSIARFIGLPQFWASIPVVMQFRFPCGSFTAVYHRLGPRQLASKVMGHVRFGFAAGCEAVAMPRRQQARLFLG